MTMNTEQFKIANGLVSCAVFAMLTVAIIAAQAQANLEPVVDRIERSAVDIPSLSISVTGAGQYLDAGALRQLEALPIMVNTLLDLPIQVDVDLETGQIVVGRKQAVSDSE